jgi:hypothetical protein
MEVTLKIDVGSSVSFPRFCSMCLKPFPDREFSVKTAKQPSALSRKLIVWSLRAPICTTCYELRNRRIAKTCAVIGGILLCFGLIFELAIGVILGILPVIGFILLIAAGIFYLLTVPRLPVKMITPPPAVTFWFKNQEYGEMFRRANVGTVICTSVTPQFPQSSHASLGDIASALGGFAGLITGIWWVISGIVSIFMFNELILGSIWLFCGILSLIGIFAIHRGKRKMGGLLIITGFLIFIITFLSQIPVEF